MFEILAGNWKLVVMALLAAALVAAGAYIKLLNSRIDAVTAERDAVVAALEVSQESVKSLRKSIDEQNVAIQTLKDSATARAAAARKEIARARASADAARKKATDIINLQKPQGVSACDAANALFNREIGNDE